MSAREAGIGVFKRIATATTTLVKTGAGSLYRIAVNTTASGAITIYDGLDAGGSVIGSLKSGIAEGVYTFCCRFTTGLCIVTAAASDITVVYE